MSAKEQAGYAANSLLAEQPEKPASVHPLALIQQAIEKGVDADYMGKLMDLQERWDKKRAEEEYWQAMNAAQAEMPAILKDRNNPFLKSKYATFESLNAAIRPIYTKHGFSLTFTEAVGAREGFVRLVCDVGHSGGHVRQHVGDYPLDGTGAGGNKSGMNAIQAAGSTRSYAKRYLAKDIFNLAETDEDNDGGGTGPTITEDQCETMNQWLEQAYPTSDALRRFMDWIKAEFGIDSISKIPASKYQGLFDKVKKRAEERGRK